MSSTNEKKKGDAQHVRYDILQEIMRDCNFGFLGQICIEMCSTKE